MKDYYIHDSFDKLVKISTHSTIGISIELDKKVWFRKDDLIKKLKDLVAYIEKYGDDNGKSH